MSSFSSRQRDGRQIRYPEIRRIPIVHFQNHNNDEETQQGISSEYVLPLTAGLGREEIKNGDSNRNIQHSADKVLKFEIPNVKLQRGSRNLIGSNTFVLSPERINSRLKRKNIFSSSNNLRVFPRSVTNEHLSASHLTEVNLSTPENIRQNNSSTNESIVEAWANRAKMTYVTVRPWNQFCLTCNTPSNLKDNCVKSTTTCRSTTATVSEDCVTVATTCPPYPTKRKKPSKTHSYSTKKYASEADQWLFFADPSKTRPRVTCSPNPTDNCFTKPTICAYKLRGSHLNTKRKLNHSENFLTQRTRNKRRNYLSSKSQLTLIKKSPKRQKNGARMSRFVSKSFPISTPEVIVDINSSEKNNIVPLDTHFSNKNKRSRIIKLKKRSLNDFRNEKIYSIVGLAPADECEKGLNLTGAIPACQKSRFYNLTSLVNVHTIKPPEYFKKQPILHLCCLDEEGTTESSTSSSSSSSVSLSSDLDDTDETTDNTNVTETDSSDTIDTSFTLVDSSSTTSPIFRMLMQLRNMPSKKGKTVTRKYKDKFYLKLLMRNKDDVTDSNEIKLESKIDNESSNESLIHRYVKKNRNPKKIHPWSAGRYCPGPDNQNNSSCCTDTSKRLPWYSSCSYSRSTSTRKNRKTKSTSRKSTSKSGKSTKTVSEASSDGGGTTSSGDEATGIGSDATDSGSDVTDSGSEATGSGSEVTGSSSEVTGSASEVTGGSSEVTGSASEVTGSSSKATSIKGKATKKRVKATKKRDKATKKGAMATISSPQATNRGIKATATISPEVANITTVKYDVESTLLQSSIIASLTSTEGTANIGDSKFTKTFEENQISLDSLNPKLDDENILLVLRVPYAVARKYSKDGNLGLVLPLTNTSLSKNIKTRSIFEQFMPSLLRKTTLQPIDNALTISENELRLLTTSANIRSFNNPLPFINDKSPLFHRNVHKHVNKDCPSCLKKRKELVFETSYGNKKANCIIDDNNLLLEEETNNYSNSYEPSTEECDDKYVSYLFEFPTKTSSKSCSPASGESHSTRRSLTILHSHDSPAKYYIKVPELLAALMNMDENIPVTDLDSMSLKDNPPNVLISQKPLRRGPRKKPLALSLQPFGINGHNVYLPMHGIGNHFKKKSKAPIYIRDIDSEDYIDDISNSSSSKPFISGFLGKNNSFLPFALVPAFLAMHLNKPLDSALKETTANVQEDEKLTLDKALPKEEVLSAKNDEDLALTLLLNDLPYEKKSLKLSKQIKGMAINPIHSKMSSKPLVDPKKPSRKSVSSRSSVSSDRPTFIILLKDMSNGPVLDDSEFSLDSLQSSTWQQKDNFIIESLEKYVN